jgi:hypothetical protein
MRKAFSLLELLVVIMTLPVLLLALGGVMHAFTMELPRGTRLVNEQAGVLDVIDAIGRDVRIAAALPDSAGGRQSDGRTLLIALPTGVVAYEQADGWVSRMALDQDGGHDPNAEGRWRLPNAVFEWQRWKQADAAYAVEIHSHIKQVIDAHPQKKLAQTRVFLLNALGRAKEVK